MKHEGHHDPEQLPVIEKEIDVGAGEIQEQFLRRLFIPNDMGRFAVEFVDIAEENLRVDFFLAAEIEIDGTFAQLCFSGDVVDGDVSEALLEKEFSGGVEDGVSPLLLFSLPSVLEPHDELPGLPGIGYDLRSQCEFKSTYDQRSLTDYTFDPILSRYIFDIFLKNLIPCLFKRIAVQEDRLSEASDDDRP